MSLISTLKILIFWQTPNIIMMLKNNIIIIHSISVFLNVILVFTPWTYVTLCIALPSQPFHTPHQSSCVHSYSDYSTLYYLYPGGWQPSIPVSLIHIAWWCSGTPHFWLFLSLQLRHRKPCGFNASKHMQFLHLSNCSNHSNDWLLFFNF